LKPTGGRFTLKRGGNQHTSVNGRGKDKQQHDGGGNSIVATVKKALVGARDSEFVLFIYLLCYYSRDVFRFIW
jgi:hypothetical protein